MSFFRTLALLVLLMACARGGGSANPDGGSDAMDAAPDAPAAYPPYIPRIMMITWDDFDSSSYSMYADAQLDGVIKLIGALDWSQIATTEAGPIDFSRLRNALGHVATSTLVAVPELDIQHVPSWFVTKYPDSVLRFGDGMTGTLSPAWLTRMLELEAAGQPAPGLAALERFLEAALTELARHEHVAGIMLPWTFFGGSFYRGAWDDVTANPSQVVLAGFDRHFRDRWNRPESIPATWADFKMLSAEAQNAWQLWVEHAHGTAAKWLLTRIHERMPRALLVVRKHIWIHTDKPEQAFMKPDLATLEQQNQLQFATFLQYVRTFSQESGWKGIAFDNDAYFDDSKIENSKETRALVHAEGFLYCGEGQNSPGHDDEVLSNLQAAPLDLFLFIPYPGGQGEQVRDDTAAKEVIRVLRERYPRLGR